MNVSPSWMDMCGRVLVPAGPCQDFQPRPTLIVNVAVDAEIGFDLHGQFPLTWQAHIKHRHSKRGP